MSSKNETRFNVEDGVIFIPGYDLVDSGQPTEEEICAIAWALTQMLPPAEESPNPWQIAARIESVEKRF